MLGKLMKYDLKSMLRVFVPIWLLAPILSLMFSLTLRATLFSESTDAWLKEEYTNWLNILMGIMGVLFAGVLIALSVMTVILIIQRFWNGLLKDEGYLMFTLPVETWELVTAKGLTATLVSCISVVVGVVSCLLLMFASSDDIILGFAEVWNQVWKYMAYETVKFLILDIVLLILAMIIGTAASIYHAYAAMALGQFFEGHRIVGSVVSYIGISVVLKMISGMLMMILGTMSEAGALDWLNQISWPLIEDGWIDGWILPVILTFSVIVGLIKVIIFHVITERILAAKLNLE